MEFMTKLAGLIIFFGFILAFVTIGTFVIMAAWSIFPLLFVGAVIFILYRGYNETKDE